MCIGKAQGFDVRNAYNELRAAIEQYAAERVAEARKPLPEEQIGQQAMQIYGMRDWTSMDIRFARAIERAHSIGEKQNG